MHAHAHDHSHPLGCLPTLTACADLEGRHPQMSGHDIWDWCWLAGDSSLCKKATLGVS